MPTSKKTSSSSSTVMQSTVQTTPPATSAVSPAPPAPATTPPDPSAALGQYVQQTVTEIDAIEVGQFSLRQLEGHLDAHPEDIGCREGFSHTGLSAMTRRG